MICDRKHRLFLIVEKAIKRFSLFNREDRIVVACSGGADSVSLFHVLRQIKDKWDLDLWVGHFNHKLRREADKDQNFVADLASNYSIPFYSESGDVKAHAQKNNMNLEEAGRELRYQFLKKIARKKGAAKIATGHTMTDQAETVLMRILRGTGPHGLGGIRPKTKEGIVRPLILAKREEVQKYIKEGNFNYRVDESNFDMSFLRNKIRHRLIPYLKNNFTPHIVDHLSRLAFILQEEDLFLQNISKEKEELTEVKRRGQIRLDMDFLQTLSPAFQRRVVREYLSKIRGDLRGISYKDIQSIIDLKRGKEFHLEKDLFLNNKSGLVGIKEESPEYKYEYLWSGETPLVIQEAGLTVKGTQINMDLFSRDFDNRKKVFLDSSQLRFPLKIRNRKAGDRYRPFGAPGKQKLKELMRAHRMPDLFRDKKPVFLSKDEIVWVQGLPVSEKHKVKSTTKNIFKIEIFPQK